MSEEEMKCINIFIEKVNKYDESIEIKGVSVGEEMRILDTVVKWLNKVENQQKEIEEIKAINNMQKYRIEVIDEREFISKSKIKEKIKEYDGLKIIDKSAWEEQVKPLIELLKENKE